MEASRLLRNANVQRAPAALEAKTQEQLDLRREEVIGNLREVYTKSMQDVPVLDKQGRETGTYTFQAAPAVRATELMGRAIGMWHHNVNMTLTEFTINIDRAGSEETLAEPSDGMWRELPEGED